MGRHDADGGSDRQAANGGASHRPTAKRFSPGRSHSGDRQRQTGHSQYFDKTFHTFVPFRFINFLCQIGRISLVPIQRQFRFQTPGLKAPAIDLYGGNGRILQITCPGGGFGQPSLEIMRARLLLLALLCVECAGGTAWAEPAFRVLVFTKTLLYHHASIAAGTKAIAKLGDMSNFAVDASEDPSVFTATNLARYRAVVFLSTTGNFMDDSQKAAFKDYVEGGGGFVAIHGALAGAEATEGDWPWYAETLGTTFVTHTPVVPGVINIVDTNNPSTAHLPARWQHSEEWYFFSSNPGEKVHVLATVDEASFLRTPINKEHPISWCRDVGKGRLFFTALGHTDECFAEPLFLSHLRGGILYATGQRRRD
jgi:type 1 glutamine amidotransferase